MKYFLGCDDSGHYYCLPVHLKLKWSILEDQEFDWQHPLWEEMEQYRMDGGPTCDVYIEKKKEWLSAFDAGVKLGELFK